MNYTFAAELLLFPLFAHSKMPPYQCVLNTTEPSIREKIRREQYHEHVLPKTKTARINGSRLISVLDSL